MYNIYHIMRVHFIYVKKKHCSNSITTFNLHLSTFRYGLKEVKKVKRLSGAGLDTSDVPGVTAGGGKWPGR